MKKVRTRQETLAFAVLFGVVADWPGTYLLIRGDRDLLYALDTGVLAAVGWFALARTDSSIGWFKSGLYLSLLGGLLWSAVRNLTLIHVQISLDFLILVAVWSLSAGLAWCVAAGCLRSVRKRKEA